ncbi:MAG: branched-chain amino acid transaminase [Nanoarchaeota archaeon]|nr:branched-chain amino acid transaminase [Nanoarchaeota archaeon]MCA9496126.1 branched-chain amino acid transaminase [Nanoarchaeota archaeon]
MLKENTQVWLNGNLIDYKDAKIGILTHSLHYGSSVFEGIRAYKTDNGPAIFRLKEHIERLFYSAECLFMKIPFSKEELIEATKKVINTNNLKSAYVRPIVYYGDESMGLNPSSNKVHVAIIAWEWGKYLHDTVRVKFSSIKRISEQTTKVDAKIGGHYINSILATLEAKKLGFDEALLLDHEGNIAEGPGENIFFIKDKTLYTPQLGKILKGITRDSIIQIAKDLDYEVIERRISPYEISAFDSAFFLGTAAEVTPISEISGTKFNVKKVNEIKNKFFEIVAGKDKAYDFWLSYTKE